MQEVWLPREHRVGGRAKFFRINLYHDNLSNYYKTNFALMQHHKYSLTELDNMMPWEREIYVTMLAQHLEEEKQRMEQQAANNKR
jgi:flagellar basal body-associated protein FliL